MPELPCSLNVHAATLRLEAEFSLRANTLSADGCSPFYRCLFAAHGRGRYLFLGFIKFFTDCLGVASPFLLRRFLDWLQSSDGDVFCTSHSWPESLSSAQSSLLTTTTK